MKILFKVIKAHSGSDVYFEGLAKRLNELGFETKIVYFNKWFEFFPFLMPLFDNNDEEPDIIHSCLEYGWVFKKAGTPLVVTALHLVMDKEFQKHTSFPQKIFHYLLVRSYIKKSLQVADQVIAISKYTQESIYREFEKDKSVKVVHCGIDPDIFKPMRVKPYDDHKFHLLFVGNLINRKGVDLLPRIMEQLGDKYVLHYTSGLRSQQPRGFDKDNMIAIGKLSLQDLVKEYNKCDALLLPSRLEGFGYAVVEAMACGKPVIISSSSSLPELIDNKCGQMFNVCDINSIIDSIKIVSSTKYKSRYIRNRAIMLFSLNTMVFLYKEHYENIDGK